MIDLSEDKYYNPKFDGVNHINVYSKGKTDVGKFLSNWSDCYVDTEFGRFRTIEGLWFFLSYRYTTFMTMDGKSAKAYGSKLRRENVPAVKVDNFNDIILNAIKTKIENAPELSIKEFLNSGLPYVHYYVINGESKYAREGQFIIDYLNKTYNNGMFSL